MSIMIDNSDNIGIYIHVPFCLSKCRYCDFYSLTGAGDTLLDAYADAVCADLETWRGRFDASADTIYFGGGTPSLLGAVRISRIIQCAARLFNISMDSAEITLEANPDTVTPKAAAGLMSGGVNRLSLGMQSSDRHELELLGRRHTPDSVKRAVEAAVNAGFDNVSVDIMLGIMGQSIESAVQTVDFAVSLGVSHISAYMLKVEEGTPLYRDRAKYDIPGEDEVCDIYLAVCARLEKSGFSQYEISNFSRPGAECRHNLKYWRLTPYIGIGPSAHSYIGKERLYYPRSLEGFLKDGHKALKYEEKSAGDIEEYVMLRLRLCEGLDMSEVAEIYGEREAESIYVRAKRLSENGLVSISGSRLQLDREGFLISNSIIAYLLYD